MKEKAKFFIRIILGAVKYLSYRIEAIVKFFLMTVVTIYLFENDIIDIELIESIVFDKSMNKVDVGIILMLLCLILITIASAIIRIRKDFIYSFLYNKLYGVASVFFMVGVLLISIKFGMLLLIGMFVISNIGFEIQRKRAQSEYNV